MKKHPIAKMTSFRTPALTLALALALNLTGHCGAAPAQAQEARGKAFTEEIAPSMGNYGVKVLFIGNSITYVNSYPRTFWELAKQAKGSSSPAVTLVGGPSYMLSDHWVEGQAIKALRSQRWNYVITQDPCSMAGSDPVTFERYQAGFDKEIRRMGAIPIIFEGYEDIPTREKDSVLGRCYLQSAAKLNDALLPVGRAFRACQAKYPRIQLWSDGHHPSPNGSYLMACLLYSYIYNTRPDLATTVQGRNIPDAAALQEIAYDTIRTARPLR